MEFSPPLISAKLIKRYKRFLSDVELPSGEITVAHVPNSGSMLGVNRAGSHCLLSVSKNPARKLSHTLEAVQSEMGTWVGVNTANTNKLVFEAFHEKTIPQWSKFDEIQREVKINAKSRLDFLLTSGSAKRFVEVKNVSMSEPPVALFPDAVTERGQKHLTDLIELSRQGFETEILFIVQRDDCVVFRPCDNIDPEYGKLLRQACGLGVIVSCWMCSVDQSSIKIQRQLKIDLK